MPSSPSQGITRRDLLKKGAALGGAVVWVTPIVQSVGMGRAFAQAPSPTPCDPGISYIAMNVTCDGNPFFIKWEDDEFDDFELEPGAVPGCEGGFVMNMVHVFGGIGGDPPGLGFSVEIQSDGTAIITVPPSCTVQDVAVKGNQLCDFLGPFGGSFPVSCPGSN